MTWTGKIRSEEKLQEIRKNIASFLVPEIIIAELPIQENNYLKIFMIRSKTAKKEL